MEKCGENVIAAKSKIFAVRVVRLYKHLIGRSKEYVLSKQLLRSGTSIGANVKEATRAQSKKDFISKMAIALKEASETEYWLELLHETEYITEEEFASIHSECLELIRILMVITKTAEGKNSAKCIGRDE